MRRDAELGTRRTQVRVGVARESAAWVVCLLFWSAPVLPAAEPTPSFRHDVLPILSRAGCNGGGCHGALAGKGGFRLSLFGYDPLADYRAIAKESRGRRIELDDPGRSLLLAKPTTALKHKGGLRIEPDSEDYRTVAAWLSAGAPPPRQDDVQLVDLHIAPETFQLSRRGSQRLTVTAEYSDGRRRDVTRWARFSSTAASVAVVDEHGVVEGVGAGTGAITAWFSSRIAISRVASPYPGSVEAEVYETALRANYIDDLNLTQLQRLNLKPSPSASENELVRRAYLDTIGRLPTTAETRAYLADTSPSKYPTLVDHLLSREEFVDYWTYKLCDILLVSGTKLRPDAVKAYYDWIRARVADNTPWDKFVREIVTAKGAATQQGATNFYAVHQDPESMAENVSQAFLSLSINCARCHNHPLEKWTNDQYYAFANLFSRVRAKGWGGDPRNGDGHRTLFVEPRGELIQPRTGKPQPPAPLDAPPLDMADPRDRREALAEWLTHPENPYFARAIANRVWASFLGVGLVEPVDDLRVSNPATNEPLLQALANDLVEQGFDLRRLARSILLSHTYQRSSRALPENRDDKRNYSRFYPRRLMAEVLSDAISDVTGVRDNFTEILNKDGSSTKTTFYPAGTRALQLFDSAVKSRFLKTFGRNEREITCECERSSQPSLVQVLHLSNGSTIHEKLAASEGRVTQLLARVDEGKLDTGALLEELWLLCLSRPPTERERRGAAETIDSVETAERREAVEDLFWSLLSSREFLFQH